MAISRQKKELSLTELTENIKKAKSVVFTKYAGTSVVDLTKLRRKARAENVKIMIAKKTLIQKAATKNGYEQIPENIMDGPIAIAFSPDEVCAAKIIKLFGKETATVQLAGGLMEGKILDLKAIKSLADLPSKEELLAQFVGMIQSPLRNFASLIANPLASF